MYRAKLYSDTFKKFVEIVKTVRFEIPLFCCEDISTVVRDYDNTSIISTKLNTLEREGKARIPIDLSVFSNIRRLERDYITLTFDKSANEILINVESKNVKYEHKIKKIDVKSTNEPKLEFDSVSNVLSDKLKYAVNICKMISDYIYLKSDGTLKAFAEGDGIKVEVELGDSDGFGCSKFNAIKLNKFIRRLPKDTFVKVCLSDNYPLNISLEYNGLELDYYLAPIIEE